MSKPIDLKKYFEEHDILILDKNTSSRSRLMKIMLDLGAKKHRIITCGHLEEAVAALSNISLGMIISDYRVGGGYGFDLFQRVRQKFPENRNLCLVLVTANISQSAVAKAAEEEVDSFIIKPYTVQSIQDSLTKTIKDKIEPTPYMNQISTGKKLLKEAKLDEAIEAFREAAKLDPKPALALFYLGHIEHLGSNLLGATGNFNKGLVFNSIHFKCLMGLYDLFMELSDYNQAYGIVRKLSKYFPSNPERLSKGIHLAVRTNNLEDMPIYYESFKELEERTAEMINYMGAGLYITGKYFFLKNKTEDALKVFEAIAVSCSEYTKFLRAMIEVLVTFDRPDVAEKYLSRFAADSFEANDYLISDFLVTATVGGDPHQVLKRGMKLKEKGIHHNLCHSYLVKAATATGLSQEKIENFSLEEKPDQKDLKTAI